MDSYDKESIKEFVYLLEKSADVFFYSFHNGYPFYYEIYVSQNDVHKIVKNLKLEGMGIINDIVNKEARYECFQILYFYIGSFNRYNDVRNHVVTITYKDYDGSIRELIRSCSDARKYLLAKYFTEYNVTLYYVNSSTAFIEIGIKDKKKVYYSQIKGSFILVKNPDKNEFYSRINKTGELFKHCLEYQENKMKAAIIMVNNDKHTLVIQDDYYDYDVKGLKTGVIKEIEQ